MPRIVSVRTPPSIPAPPEPTRTTGVHHLARVVERARLRPIYSKLLGATSTIGGAAVIVTLVGTLCMLGLAYDENRKPTPSFSISCDSGAFAVTASPSVTRVDGSGLSESVAWQFSATGGDKNYVTYGAIAGDAYDYHCVIAPVPGR